MHSFRNLRKANLRRAVPLVAYAAFFVGLTPVTLHAATITYNFTLTPGVGSVYGGTGSITIEDLPSASGISDYTLAGGNLDNVTFTIDDQTFTSAGATGTTLVRFLNGQLNDITFAETLGASPGRFTLDSTSGYAFYYDNGQAASYGTITVSPAAAPDEVPAPVSEPASLALFGTGLLLSIALLYRTRSPRLPAKRIYPQPDCETAAILLSRNRRAHYNQIHGPHSHPL